MRAESSFFLFPVHAAGLNKLIKLTSKTTLQNSDFCERNVLPPQSLSGSGNNRIQNNASDSVSGRPCPRGLGLIFPTVFDSHLNVLWMDQVRD